MKAGDGGGGGGQAKQPKAGGGSSRLGRMAGEGIGIGKWQALGSARHGQRLLVRT